MFLKTTANPKTAGVNPKIERDARNTVKSRKNITKNNRSYTAQQ